MEKRPFDRIHNLSLRIARRFPVLLFVASCITAASSQETPLALDAKVDERVELVSIIFRLAGSQEYNDSRLANYTSDIDHYFGPYREHAAVKFARKMAEKKGIGYDAPMSLAVHLSPPPDLKPLVPFTEDMPARWDKEDALRFTRLAHGFYRKTHFEKFTAAHRGMYDLAEKRFRDGVLQNVDLGWYRRFFGEMPRGHFHVLLGMNAGSYGLKVRNAAGREDIFAMVGCWTKDETGNPTYDTGYLAAVIHEFAHSFVNPAVDQYWQRFASAQKVFEPVAERMQRLAYGDAKAMVYESLVRAATIFYDVAHGDPPMERNIRKERQIRSEQAFGFVWMEELCSLLEKYETSRDRYPRFQDFMPVVADFYTSLASRVNDELADFKNKCAHVTGLQPFANHDTQVDPGIKELTVTFDKLLDPAKGGYTYPGREGFEHYPFSGKLEFLPGNKAVKLRMDLKPSWSYEFVLIGFVTPDGYPLENYPADFHTK
jgi:hypothetical protein